jgi:hypothetical protein
MAFSPPLLLALRLHQWSAAATDPTFQSKFLLAFRCQFWRTFEPLTASSIPFLRRTSQQCRKQQQQQRQRQSVITIRAAAHSQTAVAAAAAFQSPSAAAAAEDNRSQFICYCTLCRRRRRLWMPNWPGNVCGGSRGRHGKTATTADGRVVDIFK